MCLGIAWLLLNRQLKLSDSAFLLAPPLRFNKLFTFGQIFIMASATDEENGETNSYNTHSEMFLHSELQSIIEIT